MDPRDFVAVARDLLKNEQPANCRTAFNRSYYAAYHVGVALLEQAGITIHRNAKGHTQVTTFLNNCGIADLEEAQQKLVNLYSDRIKADYRLDQRGVEKSINARKALKTSENIIRAFDSFASESGKGELARGIRKYQEKIKSASKPGHHFGPI